MKYLDIGLARPRDSQRPVRCPNFLSRGGCSRPKCTNVQVCGSRAHIGTVDQSDATAAPAAGLVASHHILRDGDWFNSHDRFDEALAFILQGLRTGTVDPEGSKHYSFPPIDVSMASYQQPNPPFWYPGNPVTAGRFGLNLMWPGPIPQEAYDVYVQNWNEFAGAPVRADRPGDQPRVGVVDLIAVSHDEAEAKAIVARGWKGLFRRLVHVHELDRLALDEAEAKQP